MFCFFVFSSLKSLQIPVSALRANSPPCCTCICYGTRHAWRGRQKLLLYPKCCYETWDYTEPKGLMLHKAQCIKWLILTCSQSSCFQPGQTYSTGWVVHCLTLRSPVRAEGGGGGSRSGYLCWRSYHRAWEQGAVISPALSFRYSGTTKDRNTVLNQMKLQAIDLFIPAMNEPSDYVGMEGKWFRLT